MNFLKKYRSNIIFLSILGILFLTPLGFNIKVFLNRYINFTPSEIKKEEQIELNNYDWELLNAQNESINFKNYKGKVIFINFWATWCPPCVAEMPSFQNLYDDYKSDVVFLFVANNKPEEVVTFIKKHEYNLPIFYGYKGIPSSLDFNSLPTTYLINKKGHIIIDKKGAANWNTEEIRKILDKAIAEDNN